MDQIHTRALEALQPFIHLANSNSATSPRFIANLITNATSSPNTYVFAELLNTPAIQSLRSPDTSAEYSSYLTLLEIFAWGTWQDYECTYPPQFLQILPNQNTTNNPQQHPIFLPSTKSKHSNSASYPSSPSRPPQNP